MATANIQPTIGAYFIAAITGVGLLGIATLQSFRYFLTFTDDHILVKLAVIFVWSLEFIKSTLAINGAYDAAVKHWGDTTGLLNPNWSLKSVMMFTPVIIVVVHLFFVHRVWLILGRKMLFPLGLLVLSITGFALGVAAYAVSVGATQYEDAAYRLTDRLTMASLAFALAVDWSVTISLVILFKEQRSSFSRTKRLMKKLIFYTINIGLLTSISDLVVLIMLNINFQPFDALYSISVYEVLGNLYSNSLLAWLNSRTILSEELNRTRDLEHTTIAFRTNGHTSPTQVSQDMAPHRTTSNISQVVFAHQGYPEIKNVESLKSETESE